MAASGCAPRLAHEQVGWVVQAQQRGTGHAVLQALPEIADEQTVLVLYGDVPLIRAQTLAELLALVGAQVPGAADRRGSQTRPATAASCAPRGGCSAIVEQKDATRRELRLRECNTGVLACPARLLKRWLARVQAAQRAGRVLPDGHHRDGGEGQGRGRAAGRGRVSEVLGVNDSAQLAQLEGILRAQRARELLLNGVTLVDPARVDVRGSLSHGRDVFIDVNVVFEGEVQLGDGVRIGPDCVVRNSRIGAGTEVFAHCVIDSADIGADCNIGPFARFRPQFHARRCGAHRQFRRGEELGRWPPAPRPTT